ncbi:receptor-like cytosolic serine/threonine-protein kinase RBK2 [Ricinus communis]|nr:receptor-like cytosolic serine/threonine-protein kinase RBK2 [Ricinus communis]XP_015578202.1 receptor-like cytosolic serine/threonine-protein kinase RBK2 [Ricinus communis]|eukprot:XP_015578201.1 receptor-like cytosolic serine/threonine-protein kinase RBK2 isoform X1 [Ricinus communis]
MEKKGDTSSPVGVLEDYFRSEESESSSSKEPTSDFDSQKSSKPVSRWRGFFQLLKSRTKKPLATLHPLSVLKLSLRRSSSMREMVPNLFADSDSYNLNCPRMSFTLSELQAATNDFSQENLIGKGGYAEVYKGCLKNGKLVAIKRLIRGTADEIVGDFLSEMGIMAHVNHPNTARLIGYGIEGGMHLVLELSPHGSLASVLSGSKETLKWDIRYKIAVGTAEGIRYLHEDCQRRIIHRDIKAANILLTEDFEPQICDFGLAKWLPQQWTHHVVSKFEGTFGYLAPEYLMHGIVDEKTDVFAFGVLLLELVTGRRALDYSQQSLVLWAKPLLKKNEIRELVDPALGNDYNARQMNLILLAASLCIQQSSLRRPKITQVVQILNDNLNSLRSMKKSRVAFFRKAFREELFREEEYKSPENEMNSVGLKG